MKTELHEMIENARQLSATTREAYLRDIDRFVAFAGEDPAYWTPQTARAFYDDLLSRVTPQSANVYMAGVIYAAMQRSKERFDPRLNFTAPLQLEANDPPKQREPLTDDQARAIIEACTKAPLPWNRRDTALIVVALETGMRLMSLRSMLWEKITTSEHGYPIASVLMKGKKKHRFDVPLSDTAMLALERWRSWYSRHRSTGAVFATLGRQIQPGNVLSDTAIQTIIDERASQARLRRSVHPHIFRHTFVKWRHTAGFRLEDIALVTGHSMPRAFGKIGGYLDMRDLGNKIRNATPPWLAKLIKEAT